MADGKETQRSLAHLRATYPDSAIEKVEWWNHHAGKRHDLFGFGDILVIGPDAGLLVVQVTTRKQMSARRAKILGKHQRSDGDPETMAQLRVRNLRAVLAAGGRVLVQGWEQPEGHGTRWKMTEWEVTMDD